MNYYLCHHGIKGQQWGVRRYQTLDGSLTPAGRMRYQSLPRSRQKAITRGHDIHERARITNETPEKIIKESNRSDWVSTFIASGFSGVGSAVISGGNIGGGAIIGAGVLAVNSILSGSRASRRVKDLREYEDFMATM